jgi:aspartate racemase
MLKTVGILGGMGPEATAEFYRQLVEETPADCDQEHVPTIILSDPRVPDRTEYILGTGESFLPKILRMAKELESFGADFIVMPCNTAHLFWKELSDAVGVPVLNITEETVVEIDRVIHRRGAQIGVLATVGTLRTDLYQKALSKCGLTPLLPAEPIQQEIHETIKWIKANVKRNESKSRIEQAIESLSREGAEGVILGCTELGLVGDTQVGIPVFDSLRILARAALREAQSVSFCRADS